MEPGRAHSRRDHKRFKESKGPQIEVSRTSPELLERLFEMEVPEIYDGTVVIKSACASRASAPKSPWCQRTRRRSCRRLRRMKGSRVQAIIRELRGEKIDIIECRKNFGVCANSLSPAKVNQVRITDIENRQMEVIVNEDNSVWRSASAAKTCAWLPSWSAGISTFAAKKN